MMPKAKFDMPLGIKRIEDKLDEFIGSVLNQLSNLNARTELMKEMVRELLKEGRDTVVREEEEEEDDELPDRWVIVCRNMPYNKGTDHYFAGHLTKNVPGPVTELWASAEAEVEAVRYSSRKEAEQVCGQLTGHGRTSRKKQKAGWALPTVVYSDPDNLDSEDEEEEDD